MKFTFYCSQSFARRAFVFIHWISLDFKVKSYLISDFLLKCKTYLSPSMTKVPAFKTSFGFTFLLNLKEIDKSILQMLEVDVLHHGYAAGWKWVGITDMEQMS